MAANLRSGRRLSRGIIDEADESKPALASKVTIDVTIITLNQTYTPQRRIGELASAVGSNPKTIRYYEDIGLLPTPNRTDNGYRMYARADEERLRFIARAKHIGLSLVEIKSVMELKSSGQCPSDHVHELIDAKLMAIDDQLRTLAAFRHELIRLKVQTPNDVADDATICGIIERESRVG